MKAILLLLITLLDIYCSAETAKLAVKDHDLIIKLENNLQKNHDNSIKGMPDSVRPEILGMESEKDFYNLTGAALTWMERSVLNTDDESIKSIFEVLTEKYNLQSDDYTSILLKTFIDRINKRDLKLDEVIHNYIMYWRENTTPKDRVAPEGGGKVNWIWKLSATERPQGIVHLGIDEVTRRFICYEWNKGVYYPEGVLLERIRAEIVQVPDVARNHIGRGYLNEENSD